jgi:NTP pyrophosphatase (non-canonical NTP hydrolase)
MELNDYQTKAGMFLLPQSPPEERVLGLLSEAGEVAGVFQKLVRGDYAVEEAGNRLSKELGDVLWYIAGIARDNGWELSSIAEDNLNKLESRRLRNLLQGDGDNR